MKQILIPTNDDGLKDDLYNLYFLEYQNRGIKYLPLYRKAYAENVDIDLVNRFLFQLAIQPSLTTIFSYQDPLRALEETIVGTFNEAEISFINDFLDDISINIRLKAKDLYSEKLTELKDQIIRSVVAQNGLENHHDLIKDAFSRVEHNILSYYYLRKIGYTHVAPQRAG